MRAAVWLVSAITGCVESDSVVCGDRTCPVGTECDDVHQLCIDDDQRTPPPRVGFGLAAHTSLDSLVLHDGGTTGGDTLDDTWLFEWL